MLLAVEGGGFFSSSASGYSKGLSLLLFGQSQRSDEKHMKVSPWNQYRLVDSKPESDLQLASGKNRISRGCATFVCFGRASAGPDVQSPLKVGPTQPQDILASGPISEKEKEKEKCYIDDDDDDDNNNNNNNNGGNITLKSSLKKASDNNNLETVKKCDELEPLDEDGSNINGHTERRKVQWTDAYGNELAEIREFELSEHGESDDEFVNGNGKTCSCRIM